MPHPGPAVHLPASALNCVGRSAKLADMSSVLNIAAYRFAPLSGLETLRDELKAMKDRLAVLERLATDSNDSGARLDREIEKLRDRP